MKIHQYTSSSYPAAIAAPFSPQIYSQGLAHICLACHLGKVSQKYRVSAIERVKYLLIGVLLIIPLINAIALAILRAAKISSPRRTQMWQEPFRSPGSPKRDILDTVNSNKTARKVVEKIVGIDPQCGAAIAASGATGFQSLRQGRIFVGLTYLGLAMCNVLNAACRILASKEEKELRILQE